MKGLIIGLLSIISFFASSQNSVIRGTVYEDATGEPVIGATVLLKGTDIGTVTDLDGKFSVNVTEGSYDIRISFISFQPLIIKNVIVEVNEVENFDNLRLQASSEQLDVLVVTAEATRKSETALISMKKKSVGMMDGISSEKIQLTGDATAVEAAKRVTGVTIEGGKYIYVRGLGDRYSKTILNQVAVPGLDPDRNSLQMDIFPANLIDNLIVRKNFTADMPADFTGGLMNIETKSFPQEKFMSLSIGTSYNPEMHFNSDYLSYKGGRTDFLGFDDGTRALPKKALSPKIPTPISGHTDQEVAQFVSSFNPELATSKETSFLDYSISFSMGNQIDLKKGQDGETGKRNKLGYLFSLAYKTQYAYYDEVMYGEYQRVIEAENTALRYATLQRGELGKQNVLIGMLGGLAYKTQYSKYRLTAIRLQNGESTAGNFLIDNNSAAVGQSGYVARSNVLEYNERSLSNLLLNGRHYLENSGWEIDWRISPSYSTSDDPDIRKTAFTYTHNDTFFSAGAGGNPTRIWRSLSEINVTSKVDLTKKYTLFGEDAKLHFGAAHIYKQRVYEILFFDIQFFGSQSWTSADISRVLAPENIFPNKSNSIYYQSGNGNPNPNAYRSNVNNGGFYVSNEFTPLESFKMIFGLRAENYVQRHTGRDQSYASGDTKNGKSLNNEKVLESLDLFPSVLFIYSLSTDQNLRASYSRTIARPSFKELSFAQILDPVTNRIFNGSLFVYNNWKGELSETRIDNLDLRWELFLENGQLFSVSAFYKYFNKPIELVRIPEQQTSTEYQPRNVGNGQLYGLELEIRSKLDLISPVLRKFYISANVTVVKSSIAMTETEFNSRKGYEKIGEKISDTRQMAGQSPYVINVGLGYSNDDLGVGGGLFYNVQGPTLYIVGGGLFPDIYSLPFHSLDFGLNKKFGKNQNLVVDIKVSNFLNGTRQSIYSAYQADDQVYSSFNMGRTFGLGISYKF